MRVVGKIIHEMVLDMKSIVSRASTYSLLRNVQKAHQVDCRSSHGHSRVCFVRFRRAADLRMPQKRHRKTVGHDASHL